MARLRKQATERFIHRAQINVRPSKIHAHACTHTQTCTHVFRYLDAAYTNTDSKESGNLRLTVGVGERE